MKAVSRLRVMAEKGDWYKEIRTAFAAAGFPVVSKKMDIHWKWAPDESLRGFEEKFGKLEGESFDGEISEEAKEKLANVTKMITGVMKKCGGVPGKHKGRKLFPGNPEGSKLLRVDHAFGWRIENPKYNLRVTINYRGGYEEL